MNHSHRRLLNFVGETMVHKIHTLYIVQEKLGTTPKMLCGVFDEILERRIWDQEHWAYDEDCFYFISIAYLMG